MDIKQSHIYQDYAKFVQDNFVTEKHIKLHLTSPLSSFDDDIRAIISVFYDTDSDPVAQRMGAFFNAIYTQGASTFLLTKSIMSSLLKGDPNLPNINSCDSKIYNIMKARLHQVGIISVLREPAGRGSGLYELVHPMYRGPLEKKVGKEILDIQKTRNIEWFDLTNGKIKKDFQEKPKKKVLVNESTMTPEELERLRRGRERKQNRS